MRLRAGSRVQLGWWTGTVIVVSGQSTRVQWDERLGAEPDTVYILDHDTQDLSPVHTVA